MANSILRRKEAMELCLMEGYKLFIDRLISDKIIVLEDEPEPIVIDVVENNPVIIKRKGKIVYQD